MKKSILIFGVLTVLLWHHSCKPEEFVEPGFEDMIQMSIYDYIVDSTDNRCSSFLQILEMGGIDKTISAYNPDGEGYTLFLPDNDAIDRFIDQSNQFNSLNEILNDKAFSRIFSRYHVINKGIETNEFPFGAFPEPTLSKDFLTVTFVLEEDTAYYKINNQAPVVLEDIEASNGWIHQISEALIPVTFTTYNWLEMNPGYSIFKEAVDITGFKEVLDRSMKDETKKVQPVTLLLEPDQIYNQGKISSLNDLIAKVSPNNTNYTDPVNPLYNYVGYHVLSGNLYLDDFEGIITNYSTFSDIPLNINGKGIDLAINKAKQVFDTIVTGTDTTFIDYIGFDYDNSNVITQSGAIHFIDRIMTQKPPSRSDKYYQFHEELLLNEYKEEVGEYLIEDTTALQRINWEGADLFFVQLAEESGTGWSDDYLQIDGDFKISYTIPKIVQGKYTVYLRAEAYNAENALVEVFIDGKKIGGLIDFTYGGSGNYPFAQKELGTIDFIVYSEHTIRIESLIPGRFLWDYIHFEPYN